MTARRLYTRKSEGSNFGNWVSALEVPAKVEASPSGAVAGPRGSDVAIVWAFDMLETFTRCGALLQVREAKFETVDVAVRWVKGNFGKMRSSGGINANNTMKLKRNLFIQIRETKRALCTLRVHQHYRRMESERTETERSRWSGTQTQQYR